MIIDLKNIKNIALIGASPNKEKFGYKIFKDLTKKGYTVYLVNPNHDEIEGIKTYKSIKDLPKEKIDLMVFVIPPQLGIKILKEAYEVGFRKFWFQPGAESEEIENYLEGLKDVDYSLIKCIMVETSKLL
nr:CoA-binding protein [Petrotoga sp. 9PWA.NaAc.5.4]